MAAVVFYADRFLIFLNDYAGMGHVASAGQACRITALKSGILCFSIFFIRPDSPILQPQIQISMIFFSNCVSIILIFVRVCTKPIPIRIWRGERQIDCAWPICLLCTFIVFFKRIFGNNFPIKLYGSASCRITLHIHRKHTFPRSFKRRAFFRLFRYGNF